MVDSALEAQSWVTQELNNLVLREAYGRFLESGEWPDVLSLQRHFDQKRADVDIDVQLCIDSKPRVPGEMRLPHSERCTLELRHLMWLSEATPLLQACEVAIQMAVRSYLSSDDPPAVTGTELFGELPIGFSTAALMRCVPAVLSHENPSPFGGVQDVPDDNWIVRVDARHARRYRNVKSIAEFVACQDRIREEMQVEAAVMATGALTFDPERSQFGGLGLWPSEVATSTAAPNPVLFLSWGRSRSKRVAAAFMPILQARLVDVEVFFSPVSIEPGADPFRRLFDEGLLRSRAMIVVLTREGADSAYVIWETAVAWARDQLVIPVFVDIEPGSVPGPLTSKVQGIHLWDRADVDRALGELATHFGIASAEPVTNQEYEALVDSAALTDIDKDVQQEPQASGDSSVAVATPRPQLVPTSPNEPWDPESMRTYSVYGLVSNAVQDFSVAKCWLNGQTAWFVLKLRNIGIEAAQVESVSVVPLPGDDFPEGGVPETKIVAPGDRLTVAFAVQPNPGFANHLYNWVSFADSSLSIKVTYTDLTKRRQQVLTIGYDRRRPDPNVDNLEYSEIPI